MEEFKGIGVKVVVRPDRVEVLSPWKLTGRRDTILMSAITDVESSFGYLRIDTVDRKTRRVALWGRAGAAREAILKRRDARP